MDEWKICVRDKYPAYIDWSTFERIQAMLRDNYAEYDRNKTRGIPRPGKALLQGLVYCGQCGHKMLLQYKGGVRYLCNFMHQQFGDPVCQYLPADPIDARVLQAFFAALSPLELDAYAEARAVQAKSQRSVAKAQAAAAAAPAISGCAGRAAVPPGRSRQSLGSWRTGEPLGAGFAGSDAGRGSPASCRPSL